MSRQFGRVARVTIGPRGGQGVAVDQRFRVTFRVSKSLGRETNSMEARIYNLGERTRQRLLDQGEVMQIEAGYEDAEEVLAIADITRAIVRRNPPDVILEVQCQDGAVALRDRKINLSFEAGASVDRVLSAVADELALGRRDTGATPEGAYREGVSFSGPAAEVLDKVTRKAGLTWSIQDGDLQLLEPYAPAQSRGVLLTPGTGLIDAPEPLDDPEGRTEQRAGSGYRARALLNPKIRPGEVLVLESAEVPRTELRIDSVEHVGDTRGQDWYTEAELYAG